MCVRSYANIQRAAYRVRMCTSVFMHKHTSAPSLLKPMATIQGISAEIYGFVAEEQRFRDGPGPQESDPIRTDAD